MLGRRVRNNKKYVLSESEEDSENDNNRINKKIKKQLDDSLYNPESEKPKKL